MKKIFVSMAILTGFVFSVTMPNLNAYTYVDEDGNTIVVEDEIDIPTIGGDVIVTPEEETTPDGNHSYEGDNTSEEEKLQAEIDCEILVIQRGLTEFEVFDSVKYTELRLAGISKEEAKRKSITVDYNKVIEHTGDAVRDPNSGLPEFFESFKDGKLIQSIKTMMDEIGEYFKSIFNN